MLGTFIFTLLSFFCPSQNLRNEEQVAIIQASTVLSLAEKVMNEADISSHPVLSLVSHSRRVEHLPCVPNFALLNM